MLLIYALETYKASSYIGDRKSGSSLNSSDIFVFRERGCAVSLAEQVRSLLGIESGLAGGELGWFVDTSQCNCQAGTPECCEARRA